MIAVIARHRRHRNTYHRDMEELREVRLGLRVDQVNRELMMAEVLSATQSKGKTRLELR